MPDILSGEAQNDFVYSDLLECCPKILRSIIKMLSCLNVVGIYFNTVNPFPVNNLSQPYVMSNKRIHSSEVRVFSDLG